MSGDEAFAELLRRLKAAGYHFVTVTPKTHATVLAGSFEGPPDLRDIFGWNRPFDPSDLDPRLLELLRSADAVESVRGKLRSRVRVARLADDLLLHGAFPTQDSDAVFLGPDSYRFARFLRQRLPGLRSGGWLVDMGAGSGAGALVAASCTGFARVTLVDVNSAALRFARINAAVAGVAVGTVAGNAIPAGADIVIANPPYMMDRAGRAYRDGGDLLGGAIALDWVRQALDALAPGGKMLLYTGAAYVGDTAPLVAALEQVTSAAGASLEIDEIDPDVFGEELEQPSYAHVERIAVIGAVITRASPRS